MAVNGTSIKTASDGVWGGDNPLNCAFPLLIIQVTIVLFTSRFLTLLLKPLRQPKVVAEILGGILLGPSALGRNKEFVKLVFPEWSTPILESVASIGLLFFLFLVGLELDLTVLGRTGKKAFAISFAGISLPFVLGAGVSLFLRRAVEEDHESTGYWQFLLFIGVSLSITAFPVLARILAELKLLTTSVGQTALAAAAFNDMAAWILLALAVALPGSHDNHKHASPLISIWVLLSGFAFVIFMIFVIRPTMKWIVQNYASTMHEACICLTLAGVLVSGFITDLIGLHSIFGAFVFGLIVPKNGSFSDQLVERIEDFVSGLLLPLYFASSGLKTDVNKINGAEAWGILALVISTACVGKIIGTFLMAMMCTISARESLTLGFLMNTKGLVELVVLNIGKEKKVLNDEMFAILVLMALVTTFMTTPSVVAVYKPLNNDGSDSTGDEKEKLRILACVRGPQDVPCIIKLVESLGTSNGSLKVYVMHLMELTELSSSISMVQRTRRNGVPFIDKLCKGRPRDQIEAAFSIYGQVRDQKQRIRIRHLKSVSALGTMHEDICNAAEHNKVWMIILPHLITGWGVVNERVMEYAKCPVVAVLDHKETGESSSRDRPKRIGLVFIGGINDRKALEIGSRMAQHPKTKITLLRISDSTLTSGYSEKVKNHLH
ncbi:PREDICTED: cation/H(+) antiporter 20-like [Camelina sativa]|uniref:Cation/H(+) antiporter 20-like n=1 Tax=Camelina sativa TaxID=90675 RepID=A0ABM1RST4_CAMSA|nr:PREDICTED: cation/H(+) antiporter 20-like [Camelina sativa]